MRRLYIALRVAISFPVAVALAYGLASVEVLRAKLLDNKRAL